MTTPTFDFSLRAHVQTPSSRFELAVQCQSHASCLAIIGASGSGKSLTLRLIAGLHRPQSGHVHINGICYSNNQNHFWLPPAQRRIGLVFQEYALFPHLTVAQNIAFGRHTRLTNPTKNADPHTQYWLEHMQLEAVAHHYPHQLSGGQKQRTALARACAIEPHCLLLDEPFSALDAQLRQHMRHTVHTLREQLNIPMILVSHDREDIEDLADDVRYMQHGRMG